MSEAKRKHDISAAGAGDLGVVPGGAVLGPCPSCQAEIRSVMVPNPNSGQVERALMHPVPFCSYFGETDSAKIEHEITAS